MFYYFPWVPTELALTPRLHLSTSTRLGFPEEVEAVDAWVQPCNGRCPWLVNGASNKHRKKCLTRGKPISNGIEWGNDWKILRNQDLNVTPQIIIKQLRLLKLPKLIRIKTIHNWLAICDVRPSNFGECIHCIHGRFWPTAKLVSICANLILYRGVMCNYCNKLSIWGETWNSNPHPNQWMLPWWRHNGHFASLVGSIPGIPMDRHDRHWEALSRRWPEGPEVGAMKEVP